MVKVKCTHCKDGVIGYTKHYMCGLRFAEYLKNTGKANLSTLQKEDRIICAFCFGHGYIDELENEEASQKKEEMDRKPKYSVGDIIKRDDGCLYKVTSKPYIMYDGKFSSDNGKTWFESNNIPEARLSLMQKIEPETNEEDYCPLEHTAMVQLGYYNKEGDLDYKTPNFCWWCGKKLISDNDNEREN